jgi:hypothetical protein
VYRRKYYIYIPGICTEAEFLDVIQTKVSRVFLLAIHSHLYSVPSNSRSLLRISSNLRNLYFYSSVIYIVKEKGGKPDRKPNLLPYGLRNPNPYRKLKSENSQDYTRPIAQKPTRNCTLYSREL